MEGVVIVSSCSNESGLNISHAFVGPAVGIESIVECRLFEKMSCSAFLFVSYDVTGRDFATRGVHMPGARKGDDSQGAMVGGCVRYDLETACVPIEHKSHTPLPDGSSLADYQGMLRQQFRQLKL